LSCRHTHVHVWTHMCTCVCKCAHINARARVHTHADSQTHFLRCCCRGGAIKLWLCGTLGVVGCSRPLGHVVFNVPQQPPTPVAATIPAPASQPPLSLLQAIPLSESLLSAVMDSHAIPTRSCALPIAAGGCSGPKGLSVSPAGFHHGHPSRHAKPVFKASAHPLSILFTCQWDVSQAGLCCTQSVLSASLSGLGCTLCAPLCWSHSCCAFLNVNLLSSYQSLTLNSITDLHNSSRKLCQPC